MIPHWLWSGCCKATTLPVDSMSITTIYWRLQVMRMIVPNKMSRKTSRDKRGVDAIIFRTSVLLGNSDLSTPCPTKEGYRFVQASLPCLAGLHHVCRLVHGLHNVGSATTCHNGTFNLFVPGCKKQSGKINAHNDCPRYI